MRKISSIYKPYGLLLVVIFIFLSIPQSQVEKMHSVAVGFCAFPWKAIHKFEQISARFMQFPLKGERQIDPEQIQVLKRENYALQLQIEMLEKYEEMEHVILRELDSLKKITENTPFFERRKKELLALLALQTKFISAKVVFREPVSWYSNVWIDVGETVNHKLGENIIVKNSPVVIGDVVVGVVEYVGKNRSRVRLITDATLTPSVRVLRQESSDHYLAKGELSGASAPLWRERGRILKGVGFNYDFADEEGPARHLRSQQENSLIQNGDLLVTTGMDGVFPKGLKIARVTSVQTPREGACSYSILAETIVDLEDLAYVNVLPPYEKK